MPDRLSDTHLSQPRIGAVRYLNSRPLTVGLAQRLPRARVTYDLPSRLADQLGAGQLDVALVPSIELAGREDYCIVSDACIASDGAVRSVRLYGRVPPQRIRTLALDEGSRTSVALVRILLKEQLGLEPALERLPIGAPLESSSADAVMLIGDRAIQPANGRFAFNWDLGQRWNEWTGLPFVFAAWIARVDMQLPGLEAGLTATRDDGVRQLAEIARREAPKFDLTEADCLSYFRDNLNFFLGRRQREGLRRFFKLAARHGLVPAEGERAC